MNQKFGLSRLSFFFLVAASSLAIHWVSVSAFRPFSPTLPVSSKFLTALSSTAEATAPTTSAKQDDGLSRGDTRGAALLLEGISVSRGSSQILSNIDWRIEPKSKFALVGTNGAGKVSYGFDEKLYRLLQYLVSQ